MANPLLNTKNYAKISGIALAATALLGTVWMFVGKADMTDKADSYALVKDFLAFDWTHNILHWVLAIVALAVGFGSLSTTITRLYAQVFGVVYLGLGVFGFIMPTGLKALGLYLEIGENAIHVLIGAWGLVAGFFGTTQPTPAAASATTPAMR